MTEKTKFIDVTPTWAGLLPYFFAVLECGTNDGRKLAREELYRMAKAADLYNEYAKSKKTA